MYNERTTLEIIKTNLPSSLIAGDIQCITRSTTVEGFNVYNEGNTDKSIGLIYAHNDNGRTIVCVDIKGNTFEITLKNPLKVINVIDLVRALALI